MNFLRLLILMILLGSCQENKSADATEEKTDVQKRNDTFQNRIEKVQRDTANKLEKDLLNDSTRNAHDSSDISN